MSHPWSEISHRYACVSDDVRQRFLHPAVYDAVSLDVGNHRNCLDYGCGPGDLAVRLAEQFTHLTLVDIAPDAIEESSRKIGTRGVVRDPPSFDATEEGFDAIIFSMVLTTIEDDNEVQLLLGKLGARLADGGRLIVATTHPCFTFRALSQVSYSSSGAPYRILIEPGLEITEYHRPLDRILDLFAGAGLRIVRAREIYDAADYYRQRGEEPHRFAGVLPMFLVLTCDRPAANR
jgi:2-polyprenyl-3-methyl-5-hydroxy-6-metoxy-1,4-benzoquinol methylase